MNMKNQILLMTIWVGIFLSNILYALEIGEGINKEFYVKSDGSELYIKVRGQDITKPVLLYLHGGPGETNGPLLFQAYTGPKLEEHFVVGYLHQRNTCMSPEAPIETLTIRHFVEDIHNIVTFLQKEFQQERIYLLGHSFGGALGYIYLLEHKDNIKKFVSAGGAFSVTPIEENGYQTVMELLIKADNKEAIEELKNVGPPPYKTFHEGMVWRKLGMSILEEMDEGMTKNLDMSKVMSITEIESFDPEWQKKSMVIPSTMWRELITIDIENEVKNIDIPLLLITGGKDIIVPFRILEKGYENYGGDKEHILLEKSNHFMFIDEQDLFISKVIEFLQK
jgi:pimeloyl-ACP methyl ester carboxylesterase